jgi:hypothetical protein
MTNNNNDTSPTEETGINRKLFQGIIENSNLPLKDKEKIGKFKE